MARWDALTQAPGELLDPCTHLSLDELRETQAGACSRISVHEWPCLLAENRGLWTACCGDEITATDATRPITVPHTKASVREREVEQAVTSSQLRRPTGRLPLARAPTIESVQSPAEAKVSDKQHADSMHKQLSFDELIQAHRKDQRQKLEQTKAHRAQTDALAGVVNPDKLHPLLRAYPLRQVWPSDMAPPTLLFDSPPAGLSGLTLSDHAVINTCNRQQGARALPAPLQEKLQRERQAYTKWLRTEISNRLRQQPCSASLVNTANSFAAAQANATRNTATGALGCARFFSLQKRISLAHSAAELSSRGPIGLQLLGVVKDAGSGPRFEMPNPSDLPQVCSAEHGMTPPGVDASISKDEEALALAGRLVAALQQKGSVPTSLIVLDAKTLSVLLDNHEPHFAHEWSIPVVSRNLGLGDTGAVPGSRALFIDPPLPRVKDLKLRILAWCSSAYHAAESSEPSSTGYSFHHWQLGDLHLLIRSPVARVIAVPGALGTSDYASVEFLFKYCSLSESSQHPAAPYLEELSTSERTQCWIRTFVRPSPNRVSGRTIVLHVREVSRTAASSVESPTLSAVEVVAAEEYDLQGLHGLSSHPLFDSTGCLQRLAVLLKETQAAMQVAPVDTAFMLCHSQHMTHAVLLAQVAIAQTAEDVTIADDASHVSKQPSAADDNEEDDEEDEDNEMVVLDDAPTEQRAQRSFHASERPETKDGTAQSTANPYHALACGNEVFRLPTDGFTSCACVYDAHQAQHAVLDSQSHPVGTQVGIFTPAWPLVELQSESITRRAPYTFPPDAQRHVSTRRGGPEGPAGAPKIVRVSVDGIGHCKEFYEDGYCSRGTDCKHIHVRCRLLRYCHAYTETGACANYVDTKQGQSKGKTQQHERSDSVADAAADDSAKTTTCTFYHLTPHQLQLRLQRIVDKKLNQNSKQAGGKRERVRGPAKGKTVRRKKKKINK